MRNYLHTTNINQYKNKLTILPILFLALITIWFRLVNLGYSNYQGDEISALPPANSDQGLVNYLLEQKKGPVQYVTTLLIKQITPDYSNEFLTRLPFALAGILAIFFFYKLVDLHFGRKIALFASLFLTTNGLIIGLTRIAQYQSFVMLFSISSLYAFSLALMKDKWKVKGIYIGVLLWAAAILSHYDGVFIAPFAGFILYRWFTETLTLPRTARITHLVLSFSILGLLLLLFYLPFLFSVTEGTRSYWSYRFGVKEMKSGYSSSVVTFKLYNPLWVFYIYLVLIQLSIFRIKDSFAVFLWFLLPWEIMELVIYDPGTHIYTYIIPGTILLAFGLLVVEDVLRKIAGRKLGVALNFSGLVILFIFLASLSHFIFIDHTPEYPWQDRRYLFWTISKPETKGDLWIFGFPYNRRWDEVREFVSSNSDNHYYSTNEKPDIAGFYTSDILDVDQSGYYVHVHNPQSFKEKIAQDKIRYWKNNYRPIKVFKNNGSVVVEIYQMPPGNLKQIIKEGY